MNIHHLIGEILEELKTLREENALLRHEVAALHAQLELVEHKVDSVAEEMGMI
jgi:regulator of replication initiation timing